MNKQNWIYNISSRKIAMSDGTGGWLINTVAFSACGFLFCLKEWLTQLECWRIDRFCPRRHESELIHLHLILLVLCRKMERL